MSTTSRSPLSPLSSTSSSSAPAPFSLKRKTMSITQTYYLAHTARGKLSHEAARADHNLRLLVGHANLLDSLMLELAEAEREQETWFNQSIKSTKNTRSEERRHIQWADAVVEEPEEDWQAEDVDSDSSSEDSDYDSDDDYDLDSEGFTSLHRVQSQNTLSPISSPEEEEDYDDEEEDIEGLQLKLTPSRSAQQPPELDHDSDSSEDESMPPSPPSTVLKTFTTKQKQQIATTGMYPKATEQEAASIPPQEQQTFLEEGFYLPQRNQGLITAISVY
ncbi:hypothetical protein F5884DRAFT_768902 [Xylogone sp. PMI_703]|nr:hypothetical protein F5884DRAFT_768902 [Xylogone sp. PMI_703]